MNAPNLVAFLVVALVGCGGSQKSKVAKLQKRVDYLEDKIEAMSDDDGASVVLAERVEAHEERLGKLETQANRVPRRLPTRPRPDPNAVYSVGVTGRPSVGAKNAWVTVVKASEFACPFCERARPTMDTLLKDYKGDIRIVYRHFVVHPQSATIPAHAACAAHKQGKFKKMYNLIWDRGFKAGRDLSKANMIKLGRQAGLKIPKMKKDMESDCPKIVREDQSALQKVGVLGTPAFYINGRFLSGARPVSQFKVLVDEELAKAKASGIPRKDYYQHIVKTGLKKFTP